MKAHITTNKVFGRAVKSVRSAEKLWAVRTRHRRECYCMLHKINRSCNGKTCCITKACKAMASSILTSRWWALNVSNISIMIHWWHSRVQLHWEHKKTGLRLLILTTVPDCSYQNAGFVIARRNGRQRGAGPQPSHSSNSGQFIAYVSKWCN